MTDTIARVAAALERAPHEYAAALAAVKDGRGQPIYAEGEQERRELEAWDGYRRTVAEAAETVVREGEEAREVLAGLDAKFEGVGALDTLTSSELQMAVAKDHFVGQDFDTLPLEAIARRARAAHDSGSRVDQILYFRHARRVLGRLTSERGVARDAESGEWSATGTPKTEAEERLEAAASSIRNKLTPIDDLRERAKQRERLEAASSLVGTIALARVKFEDYVPRPRAATRPGGVR